VAADGYWSLAMNSPLGTQNMFLTLATSGSVLSGCLDAPHPLGKVDFDGGTADGDNLAWTLNPTAMPMIVEFTGTVSGDTISGDVKIGDFGTATYEGTRSSEPPKTSSKPTSVEYRSEDHRHEALSAEWVGALRSFCIDNGRFTAHNLEPITITVSWEFNNPPAHLVRPGHKRAAFFIRIEDGKVVEVGDAPPAEADSRIIMSYDPWASALSLTLEEDMAFTAENYEKTLANGSMVYEGDVMPFMPYMLILRKEFFPVYTA
jgi:hypothetical protein